MTAVIEWYLEDRILFVKSPVHYTLEELTQMDQLVLAYFDQATVPLVHVIFDNSATLTDPGITAWARAKSASHARCGWVVGMNTKSRALKFFYTTAAQILKVRYRQFDTMTEAVKFLQSVDATLPDLTRELASA